MQPFSLSLSWIMIDESLEGMTEGKVTRDAKKNMTSWKNLTFKITSICHVVMLLFVLMKSFQAPLTAFPLNLENVMMSCAHAKICSVTPYKIKNIIYQFLTYVLDKAIGWKLCNCTHLRLSMRGNYGSAIKMMGQDKRQLIWNISHEEYFLRYYERYLWMKSSKKVYKKAKLS